MNQSRQTHMRRPRHGGFTLVELLIAMAVTLILIFALAQAFAIVGDSIAKGRAAIEMAGNLRGVAHRLQKDLDGLTVSVRPWTDDAAGPGYFEILEGIGTDLHPLPELPRNALSVPSDANQINEVVVPNIYGDIDDVLAFTAYAGDAPFRGVHVGTAVESGAAEIVWFTRFEDFNENGVPDSGEVSLYRRVLVIRPDYTPTRTGTDLVALMLAHYRESDISARPVLVGTQWQLRANSLADLANRKNRFAHFEPSMLYVISRRMLVPRGTTLLKQPPGSTLTLDEPGYEGRDDDLNGNPDDASEIGWFGSNDVIDTNLSNITNGYGHDKVLAELLAFDVRAFDPSAEVRAGTGEPLVPGDPGWPSGTKVGEGAFVDLNYGNMPNNLSHLYSFDSSSRLSAFSGLPMFFDQVQGGSPRDYKWTPLPSSERLLGVPYSQTNAAAVTSMGLIRTQGVYYCTWPTYYERDGFDQDNDSIIDEGTNGFDDDGINGVDDVGERETSPPYPVPLRGIQIRIRTWDPDSRQVRQATVVADFVPE